MSLQTKLIKLKFSCKKVISWENVIDFRWKCPSSLVSVDVIDSKQLKVIQTGV